jgi:DNA polymerase III subunit delta
MTKTLSPPSETRIFLFTGDNTFEMMMAVSRWKQAFVKKHSDCNLARFSAQSLDIKDLLQECASPPFAAESRLVIVEGIPKLSKEEIEMLRDNMHPSTVLLFFSSTIDKRLTASKTLLKIADISQFPIRTARDLSDWVKTQEYDIQLSDELFSALLDCVGNDQWALHTELTKLSLFLDGKEVTKEDIEALVVPSGENIIWTLTDLLSNGQTREALSYAHRLLERGEDPFSLWNILLWMIRNLTLVHACLSDGISNPKEIASRTKMPFLSARSLIPLARSLSLSSLSSLISSVTQYDLDLKAGAVRASIDEPEELLTLLDRTILSMTP